MRLTCLVTAFIGCVQAQLAAPEMVALAERPKLAIYAGDVTVDGRPRPDLGRALADSISAGLLKRGQVRVFSIESAATMDAATLASLPSSSAVRRAQQLLDKNLDYLLTFNLLGMDHQYLLTVKKTRAQTNEIVEAHQFTTVGRVGGIFNMMSAVMERVDPRPVNSRPVFPRTQSPATLLPDPPAVLVRTPPAPAWQQPASPAYDPWRVNVETQYDLSNVPKALVYQKLGSINYINKGWKFCILDPVRGARLNENDRLHVLWDEGDVYAHLRVCAVENGGVVADLGHTPDHHPLFPGDEVYGWAPPMALMSKEKR